jgi:hypothetical protein
MRVSQMLMAVHLVPQVCKAKVRLAAHAWKVWKARLRAVCSEASALAWKHDWMGQQKGCMQGAVSRHAMMVISEWPESQQTR